jgi:hypothetical protein
MGERGGGGGGGDGKEGNGGGTVGKREWKVGGWLRSGMAECGVGM